MDGDSSIVSSAGKPRLPLPEMAPEKEQQLRRVMDEPGVIEKYGKK